MAVEPWWTKLADVPRDNHFPEPHRHLDHQYLAVADSPEPVAEPEHPFRWYRFDELHRLDMCEDTRLLAAFLSPHIDDLDRARAVVGVVHESLIPKG